MMMGKQMRTQGEFMAKEENCLKIECSWCKKDMGFTEDTICGHLNVSHSICPECFATMMKGSERDGE